MAVAITGTYLGGLKTELTHEPSGTRIRTAAPLDNNGDGSSFSPTDLAAAALASCMVTILGILAERDGLALDGSWFRVEKRMTSTPRRIGSLTVEIHLPAGLPEPQRRKLERGALTCPVHRSLHPEVEDPVTFVYDVAGP